MNIEKKLSEILKPEIERINVRLIDDKEQVFMVSQADGRFDTSDSIFSYALSSGSNGNDIVIYTVG